MVHFHRAAALNTIITDYTCDRNLVTFVCSDIAQVDIADEIRSADQLTRCSSQWSNRSDIMAVKFANCKLAKLPDGLLQLPNLLELDMTAIALESLAVEDFQNISWMRDKSDYDKRTLILSSNHLTRIEQPVFFRHAALQVLDLSNNRIRSLGASAFAGACRAAALVLAVEQP